MMQDKLPDDEQLDAVVYIGDTDILIYEEWSHTNISFIIKDENTYMKINGILTGISGNILFLVQNNGRFSGLLLTNSYMILCENIYPNETDVYKKFSFKGWTYYMMGDNFLKPYIRQIKIKDLF